MNIRLKPITLFGILFLFGCSRTENTGTSAETTIPSDAVTCEFGIPVIYPNRRLDFDFFSIVFLQVTEEIEGNVGHTIYEFSVIGRDNLEKDRFVFVMSGLYDPVCFFEVDGEMYATEMFFSTAGAPASRLETPLGKGHLQRDQIVVWDVVSAKEHNLQVYDRLTENKANK